MSKTSKFYGVKYGRCPGIYSSWEECKNNVEGYTGAKFRKFNTYEEAQQFVSDIKNENFDIIDDTVVAEKEPSGIKRPSTAEQRPIGGVGCTCVCTCGNGAPPPQKKQKITKPIDDPVPPPGLSKDGYMVIYTDGACEGNGKIRSKGGIGVYWGPNHPMNISEPLLGRQTNNRAEIMAAVRALNQCKMMGTTKVKICTDSNFLINGITTWINKWKKNGWKLVNGQSVINREDFEKLDEARQGLDVKWVHVRGHRGITGNEEADRLAREGVL